MRKIIFFFILFSLIAFLFPNFSQSRTPETVSLIYRGDIYEDGEVNVFDLIEMLKMINDPAADNERSRQIADFDGSGTVDSFDLVKMLKYLSGNIPPVFLGVSGILYDVDYQQNCHFLLVDTSLIAAGRIDILDSNGVALKDAGNKPEHLRVFKDDGNLQNNRAGLNPARRGFMYLDPNSYDPGNPFDTEFGWFNEMVINRDYILEPCGLVISFSYVDPHEKIGVIYETSSGRKVGGIENDTLKMKMIKSAGDPNHLSPVWPLTLRNVYSFSGGIAVNSQTLHVEIITDEVPTRLEENGKTFLEIFGLDDDADNKIDPINVDYTRGLIFFPSLEPFSRPYTTDGKLIRLSESNPIMYSEDDFSKLTEARKYIIVLRNDPVLFGN